MSPVNADHAWEAVLNRDRRCDGRFVYAVSSTRVYCRPSCPSRRPTRHHVMFFDSAQRAEAAGYRACMRCRPQSSAGSEAEERVERARRYLDEHADEPITLQRLATQVGLSPFHLQRAFTREVGLSPKAYQDAKRMERFTASLRRGETVTSATYEAGFGSSSRLYARVTYGPRYDALCVSLRRDGSHASLCHCADGSRSHACGGHGSGDCGREPWRYRGGAGHIASE